MKTKGILIAVLMMLAMGALVFAQNTEGPWGQTVTVEGTLQLQNGHVVLVSGDTSYFVPWLLHYAGFIEGIKEGATVSVEGYTDGYDRLWPTSFTVNGKSYDLARFGGRGGYRGGGFGAGGCGNWEGGYGRHRRDWDDDDDWDDRRRSDRRGGRERGRRR